MPDHPADSISAVMEARDRLDALHAAHVRLARTDFGAFMEYVFVDDSGRGFSQQWFHDEWADGMDRHDRLLIICCRDTGKTTQVVGRAIWELGRNPDLRIKIVCASDGKAKERLFEIVQHIEQNPRVREVFPNLEPAERGSWSKHQIVVRRNAMHRDASVEALGIGSTATGGRADLLIADDVVDRRNALEMPAMREGIKQAWKSDWTNLLEPGGRIWYICTLWHKCLPVDAPVMTANGIIKAGAVTLSTRLRTGSNLWECSHAVTRRQYIGKLVSMRVGGMTDPLRCTPEHRWPTQRGDIAAGDLRVGDWLRLNLDDPHTMTDREALTIGPQPDPVRAARPTSPRQRPRREGILEWVQALIDEGISYETIAKLAGYSGKSWTSGLVRRHGLRPGVLGFKLKRAPGADIEFWRLCGYYCAEGDINADNHAVRLSFGHNAEERRFADDAAICARNTLGVRAAIHPIPHGTSVQFSCRAFSDWCVATFGKLAENIRLPSWFIDLPRPLIDAWMLGYWNGDGSHSVKLSARAARFSTTSPHLAYTLQRIIPSVYGVPASVYRSPREGAQDFYDVRCSDEVLTTIGAEIIPWQRRQRRTPHDVVLRDNAQWMRVKKITKKEWSGDVVDVATSTGYFDVAGVTTHNSDLSHLLMANPAYKVLFYAVDEQFGSLWPEKWSTEELLKRYREINDSVEFNRAFRNQAVDVDSAMIRSTWLKYERLANNPEFIAHGDELIYITAYDTADAPTGGKNQDYTAGCVVAADPLSQKIYVIDAWHDRLTVKDQAERVFKEWRHYRPFRVVVEKAGLSTLAEWTIEAHPEMAGHIEIIRPRVSKSLRLMEVTPMLQGGQVIFSHHLNPDDDAWSPNRGSLPSELIDFPLGKHDDLVDAWQMAVAKARVVLAQYQAAKTQDTVPKKRYKI
jgi:predicted phage terminase large subunit-like protein